MGVYNITLKNFNETYVFNRPTLNIKSHQESFIVYPEG
jgi:hypothetical protein